jgi:hypothetical protein
MKELGLDIVSKMTAWKKILDDRISKVSFHPNNTCSFLQPSFPNRNTYWSVLVTAKVVRDCSDITIF